MMTRPLGKTGFSIAPLVFGGNVFGWTIDEKTSFAILDAKGKNNHKYIDFNEYINFTPPNVYTHVYTFFESAHLVTSFLNLTVPGESMRLG